MDARSVVQPVVFPRASNVTPQTRRIEATLRGVSHKRAQRRCEGLVVLASLWPPRLAERACETAALVKIVLARPRQADTLPLS
jgi:hypothetical protein